MKLILSTEYQYQAQKLTESRSPQSKLKVQQTSIIYILVHGLADSLFVGKSSQTKHNFWKIKSPLSKRRAHVVTIR